MSTTRDEAQEFFDDLLNVAGKHRLRHLGIFIEHLESQELCWKSSRLARLKSLRDTMRRKAAEGDVLYSPLNKLRGGRTKATRAIGPRILTLLKADAKRLRTLSDLGAALGKSRSTVYLVTMDMRARGEIMLVDESQGLYGLPTQKIEIKKPISLRMLEHLIANGPTRFVPLESAIGEMIAAALFRLRRAGVLKPADHTSPIGLSEDAQAKIRDGWTAQELTKLRARPADR
jgi:hypothetical protein